MKKLNAGCDYTIGIDMGGTMIKGVLVNLTSGEVLRQLSAETYDGRSERLQQHVAGIVDRLQADVPCPVNGIGLAAPGIASSDQHSVVHMPGRMTDLEGFDWQAFLQCPVRVMNDAHAAVLAEVYYGSAQGIDNAIMLTLGTGVGGGLWLNGELYQGQLKSAGHLGHISIDAASERRDITKSPGSLEDAIGNATVPFRTFNKYKDTEELVKAYIAGEPVATLAWLTSVRCLAAGITSLINTLSPEAIVIGGGIACAGEALFRPLESFMDVFEWRPLNSGTPIRRAHFMEWAGAVGAAVSIRQQSVL